MLLRLDGFKPDGRLGRTWAYKLHYTHPIGEKEDIKEVVMWFVGTNTGVSFWFILWGRKETIFALEIFKRSTGVKKWLSNKERLAAVRIGRIEVTEAGPIERECWNSEEEFLKWYQNPKEI